MASEDFLSAIKIAIDRGDFTSNKRSTLSEELSGYEGSDYVLKNRSGEVIARIFSGKLENRQRGSVSSNQSSAIEWAISMGYPVPTKWDGCLTTFLIVIGVCAYVVPGLLILLFVWYNGNQYERDMKALVAKWIDAGKPKPGEKVKPIEKLEKVEEKPVELPSSKAPSTESRLEELLSMKGKGLISQEEYDILRKKALGL